MIAFTKINWAGSDHILITDNERARYPIILLDQFDIKKLNREWRA